MWLLQLLFCAKQKIEKNILRSNLFEFEWLFFSRSIVRYICNFSIKCSWASTVNFHGSIMFTITNLYQIKRLMRICCKFHFVPNHSKSHRPNKRSNHLSNVQIYLENLLFQNLLINSNLVLRPTLKKIHSIIAQQFVHSFRCKCLFFSLNHDS